MNKYQLSQLRKRIVNGGIMTTEDNATVDKLFADAAVHEASKEYEKAMRLLEKLTPGGSEFYNAPETCYEFIRSTMSSHLRLAVSTKIELNEALKTIAVLQEKIEELEAHIGKEAVHSNHPD